MQGSELSHGGGGGGFVCAWAIPAIASTIVAMHPIINSKIKRLLIAHLRLFHMIRK